MDVDYQQSKKIIKREKNYGTVSYNHKIKSGLHNHLLKALKQIKTNSVALH